MNEVKLKRYAGPFTQIPEQYQDDYIQSPIGLVSKDGGKDTRLIFHLSHPWRKVNGKFVSLNANTPSNKCKVAYLDFSEAILRCLEEGVNCHLSKSDVRSAFCQLGISKRFWRYLIMKARNPLDGKWYYFIDKCLPFGASINCALFQKVSDALAYLVEHRTGRKVVNYLDDFLFVALLAHFCNQQVRVFIEICKAINMPISEEKTTWASMIIVFLGLLMGINDYHIPWFVD